MTNITALHCFTFLNFSNNKASESLGSVPNLKCAPIVFHLPEVQGGGLLLCEPGFHDFNDILGLDKALQQGLKSRQSVEDTQLLD